MNQNFVYLVKTLVQNLENLLRLNGGPLPALAFAINPQTDAPSYSNTPRLSLKDLLGDGMLWAVPKHRRSVEKRLNRKFGYPEYVWKPLKEKRNLRTCTKCGHDYELGLLCRKFLCYSIYKYSQ